MSCSEIVSNPCHPDHCTYSLPRILPVVGLVVWGSECRRSEPVPWNRRMRNVTYLGISELNTAALLTIAAATRVFGDNSVSPMGIMAVFCGVAGLFSIYMGRSYSTHETESLVSVPATSI